MAGGVKKPETAPTFTAAFEAVNKPIVNEPDRLARLYGRATGPTLGGHYLHWDQLKHRTPPNGLSRLEWWFLAKLSRTSARTNVPLKDKNRFDFGFVSVDPIPQRLHEIDLQAGGQIEIPEQVTNRETKDQYYVSSLIEEAITSSQLEGATTTRKVAKEMLRTGRPPRDRSERMILNNYITMRRIGELKRMPLTKELVFEIHRLVTDEALDDPTGAGRFRRADEPIGVYEAQTNELLHAPPPADSLEQRMVQLCTFANETDGPFVHPVIRSIILHFMIGYDHPFIDGNGRTARALFYWSMLRHGYWLAEFISISHIVLKAPAKYGRAFLYTETDERDLTYFILYHLEVIMQAVQSLRDYIARQAQEIRRLEDELRGIEFLNYRQRALIRHAARHPNKRYTIEEHRRSHEVSYETARSDLLGLVQQGLLTAGQQGKKSVFTAKSQLNERLAAIGAGSNA